MRYTGQEALIRDLCTVIVTNIHFRWTFGEDNSAKAVCVCYCLSHTPRNRESEVRVPHQNVNVYALFFLLCLYRVGANCLNESKRRSWDIWVIWLESLAAACVPLSHKPFQTYTSVCARSRAHACVAMVFCHRCGEPVIEQEATTALVRCVVLASLGCCSRSCSLPHELTS